MAKARTADPPFAGKFFLTVDDYPADDLMIGAFTEVSGLSVQIEVEELAEGGQNQYTHKLPGRMKWPNLVFKRGITDTDKLCEWFARCSGAGVSGVENRLERRNGAVTLFDAAGKQVRSWRFIGAYPVKWTGPRLAAASRDLGVEELEVCHCGFSTKV